MSGGTRSPSSVMGGPLLCSVYLGCCAVDRQDLCGLQPGSYGSPAPAPVTVAVAVPVPVPVPGVDVPAVLQSPSASLNKITYSTACDELLPFLQLTSTLSSAKAFNKRSTAIKSHPSQLTANEIK